MATLTELLLAVRMDRAGLIRLDLGVNRAARIESARKSFAHYVIEGSISVEVGGQDPVTLGAGDFALLAHGDSHIVRAGRPLTTPVEVGLGDAPPSDAPYLFSIGAGGARLLSAAFGLEHRRGSKSESIVPDLVVLRGGTLDLPRHDDTPPMASFLGACEGAGAGAFAGLFIQMLFGQAIRLQVAQADARSGMELGALQLTHIQTAIRLMNGQPERDWSVGRLARAVGMSRTSFAAAFVAAVGDTPVHHLRKVRLERACELLATRDDLSIPDVAKMVGYTSAPAFTRAFRQGLGRAPHAFRLKSKGVDGRAPRTAAIGTSSLRMSVGPRFASAWRATID